MSTDTTAWNWRWKKLWDELAQRAKEPFGHPTFILFFIGIVIVVGGVGTWVEIFRLTRPPVTPDPFDGLVTSLITFFFALVGTSCTQIIIEEAESKALRALAQLVLILAIGGAVMAAAGVGAGEAGIIPWSLASIFALIVWWMANAKSPGLRDPDIPTGGDLSQKLSGTTTGYKT